MESKTISNFISYRDGHWSQERRAEDSLLKYLDQYEDYYNKRNLTRILKEVHPQPSLKVLDYGGGVGIVSVSLAKMGHDVTLIDQSVNALHAAELFAERSNCRINTVMLDRGDDLDEGMFDLVIAKDVIEHIVDDADLFVSLYERLKPSGRLIVTTQNKLSANYFIEGGLRRIFHPSSKWLGWDRTHLRFYSPGHLEKLGRTAGFSDFIFKSAYLFPYKLPQLIGHRLFGMSWHCLTKIDEVLMQIPFLGRFGWNIMMICKR